jgi:hypothetical protein
MIISLDRTRARVAPSRRRVARAPRSRAPSSRALRVRFSRALDESTPSRARAVARASRVARHRREKFRVVGSSRAVVARGVARARRRRFVASRRASLARRLDRSRSRARSSEGSSLARARRGDVGARAGARARSTRVAVGRSVGRARARRDATRRDERDESLDWIGLDWFGLDSTMSDAVAGADETVGRRTTRRGADGGAGSAQAAARRETIEMRTERYANCRVHKNCGDAYCEFRKLAWEFRAVRDRAEAKGSKAKAVAEAWVRAAMKEDDAWNEAAERERKRLRAEAAKVTKAMELAARSAPTERELRRARAKELKRLDGDADVSEEPSRAGTPPPETEEEKKTRQAMEIYEKRMQRVRDLTKRRAMLLARASTVVVHPGTNKVIALSTPEELSIVLKIEAKKKAQMEQRRRQRGLKRPMKGPNIGDMYRMPRLFEEVWLYEDSNVDEPTISDLIHMNIGM